MFSAESWEQWKPIFYQHGAQAALSLLHIIVVVIAGWLVVRALRRLLVQFERVITHHHAGDDAIARSANERRVKTLSGVLRTIITIGTWALVITSCLNEFGINIGPILAGVGIAGLAVGFGAQNLVRDMISGFFLILENNVRVGDVATVNGVGGSVESISFRTMILRDVAGVVHVFPHGSITTLANHTMYWSAYVFTIGVSYSEDVDRTMAVMRRVYEDLKADPAYAPRLLDPIEVFGIDDFGPSQIVIKARLKTVPGEQWGVGREYRRRLKYAFDREGIVIPYPQQTIHLEGAGAPSAA
jgi:small conductance mechanosensitive channel